MLDRIVVDPTVHFGKACVRGTRIPVHDVIELVQQGVTFREIVARYYPELTIEDVQACLAYVVADGGRSARGSAALAPAPT